MKKRRRHAPMQKKVNPKYKGSPRDRRCYILSLVETIKAVEFLDAPVLVSLDGLARTKKELAQKLKLAVNLPELTLEPFFEGDRVPVHPAIDIVGGYAYVGVTLPTSIKRSNGKESVKNMLWLVRSDGKLIPTYEKALEKEGIRLKKSNMVLARGWSLDSFMISFKERRKLTRRSFILL
ncbi:MAG: hypothetical protein QW660_08755 [Candidatus Bathyarchaeia archaeon]